MYFTQKAMSSNRFDIVIFKQLNVVSLQTIQMPESLQLCCLPTHSNDRKHIIRVINGTTLGYV